MPRESEGVTRVVGELDDLVSLIVVTENNEAAAERGFRRGYAAIELLIGQTEITLRKRLALRDMCLLELRQDRKHRRHLNF
jgi:hypothetical protein